MLSGSDNFDSGSGNFTGVTNKYVNINTHQKMGQSHALTSLMPSMKLKHPVVNLEHIRYCQQQSTALRMQADESSEIPQSNGLGELLENEAALLEELKIIQKDYKVRMSIKGMWLFEKMTEQEVKSKQIDLVVTSSDISAIQKRVNEMKKHGFEIRVMSEDAMEDFDFVLDLMWYDVETGLVRNDNTMDFGLD